MKKIGIKPNHRLLFQNAPPDFDQKLGELPEGTVQAANGKASIDVGVLFVKSAAELEREFGALARRLAANGMLWIGWPKLRRSRGIRAARRNSERTEATGSESPSDLNENVVREIGLTHGLVDVKVCAIDETWSGLKFVYRVKDRKQK